MNIPAADKPDFDERAGIYEYDYGLPRVYAERRAWDAMYMRKEVWRNTAGVTQIKYTLVAPTPEPKPEHTQPVQCELDLGPDDFRQAMRQIWKDY